MNRRAPAVRPRLPRQHEAAGCRVAARVGCGSGASYAFRGDLGGVARGGVKRARSATSVPAPPWGRREPAAGSRCRTPTPAPSRIAGLRNVSRGFEDSPASGGSAELIALPPFRRVVTKNQNPLAGGERWRKGNRPSLPSRRASAARNVGAQPQPLRAKPYSDPACPDRRRLSTFPVSGLCLRARLTERGATAKTNHKHDPPRPRNGQRRTGCRVEPMMSL